mmetsp:Transcript_45724/g.115571  ORF Transcript_45724/g.115571 Transcript_45724/m.115571 type:complete len:233 (+) Transcript_45724:189-887(+)
MSALYPTDSNIAAKVPGSSQCRPRQVLEHTPHSTRPTRRPQRARLLLRRCFSPSWRRARRFRFLSLSSRPFLPFLSRPCLRRLFFAASRSSSPAFRRLRFRFRCSPLLLLLLPLSREEPAPPSLPLLLFEELSQRPSFPARLPRSRTVAGGSAGGPAGAAGSCRRSFLGPSGAAGPSCPPRDGAGGSSAGPAAGSTAADPEPPAQPPCASNKSTEPTGIRQPMPPPGAAPAG